MVRPAILINAAFISMRVRSRSLEPDVQIRRKRTPLHMTSPGLRRGASETFAREEELYRPVVLEAAKKMREITSGLLPFSPGAHPH